MFVFLVPNISQVMMKYEMEPPSYTTRQISFVWHNGRRATTQLGRFTLWHNSRQDKQRGFIDACIRSRTHFPKTVTNHAKKYEGLIQGKILLRVLNALEDSTNTDRQQTFSKLLKYVRFTKTNRAPRTHELPRELARQSEAKRKQSPQRETNVC